MDFSAQYAEVGEALGSAKNVLAVCHISPDGDALGSLTAVGLILQSYGLSHTLVCDDGSINRFSYLALSDQIQTEPNERAYDVLIAVDCGDAERMGYAYSELPAMPPTIINIDHHITNTDFGTINIVDTSTTSTCEILFNLVDALDIKLTQPIANSLLTGMVTDTLSFRIPAVTSRTLEVASQLVAAGAELPMITREALNLQPHIKMKLWGIGLSKMKLEGGVAYTSISKADRAKLNYLGKGASGLSSLLGDIEEASMGIVMVEGDDNAVYLSLRSRPPFNVSDLARDLGGGGHAQASGCRIEGSLKDVVKLVVPMAKDSVREQSGD